MKKIWFSLLSFGYCCWLPVVVRTETASVSAGWKVQRPLNPAVGIDTLPRTKGTSLGIHALLTRRVKPNLFLISVGANYERRSDMKLAFAQADAQAIFQRFKTQEGHLFGQVKGHVLVCEQETYRVMLDEAIDTIQKEGITADDILILFFSGHGTATNVHGTDDFGLITGDVNLGVTIDRNRLYTYQHDIVDKIKDLPCKRIIFLDACHSGAAKGGKSLINSTEQAQAIIQQTPSGIVTLSSCQENESSWEDSSWKQGAFTRALLDGLAGAANQSNEQGQKDKFITIRELAEYVENTVPKLVEEMQKRRNQGAMSYPAQHPHTQNRPESDYPLFDFRDLAKEIPPVENPCKGPGPIVPPVFRQHISVVGIIPPAAEVDWLITNQALNPLKTKFSSADVTSGVLAASTMIQNGLISAILDGRTPPNQSLPNGLDKGFLFVVFRSPQTTRSIQRAGRQYYGVRVPITVAFIDGKTSQITRQQVFAEEGVDSDSTLAESESIKLAFDRLVKSDFALPN